MYSLSRRAVALMLLAAATIGLLPSAAPAQDAASKPVLFFAAASLQNALKAIAAQWEKETGKKVTFSFAASSALAKQIESGAPADLFASADLKWMDWAQEKKLVKAETRKKLLGNSLVLIASTDNKEALKIAPNFPLATAIGDSRLATGTPGTVPVGTYAKAAMTALGVWDQVSPKIAATDNVRAALALVAKGEAKYGIVYKTDANAEKAVRVVDTFPANTHEPIVYPFAVTAVSANPDAAAFLAYLSTPAAVKIFEAEGFTVQH
jgi:molybdate transport system substrate-binding protein